MPRDQDIRTVNVPTLQRITARGQVWQRMSEKYGVTNAVPPWKSSLDGMCDALDTEGTVLPLSTRRHDEDRLATDVYQTLPFPENQLVALAHSMIARQVIAEDELAERMKVVRARLEADDPLPDAESVNLRTGD